MRFRMGCIDCEGVFSLGLKGFGRGRGIRMPPGGVVVGRVLLSEVGGLGVLSRN